MVGCDQREARQLGREGKELGREGRESGQAAEGAQSEL